MRAPTQAQIQREAQVFDGKRNSDRRALGWGSIPYFQTKLAEKLNLIKEALAVLGEARGPRRALTLACGDMTGEYRVLSRLGATEIDAFDISEGQRQRFFDTVYDGAVPVDYRIADANTLRLPEARYDIVYMQQSLHHLVKIEEVVRQLHRSLTPGGVFVLNDYVGEPFLQRGPKQRAVCQEIWSTLPARLRTKADGTVLDRLHIPPKASLSPFEAVRADAILPALHATFRVHKEVVFGGVVFPIVNNFAPQYELDGEPDKTLIKLLWALDETLTASGAVEPTFVRGIYGKRGRLGGWGR